MSTLLCAKAKLCDMTLEIHMGSALSLAEPNGVLVNAANEKLANMGGIAGQIVTSGGEIIQKECDEYINKNFRLRAGFCHVTTAGRLGFKNVLHVVGPMCQSEEASFHQRDQLVTTVCCALEKAQDIGGVEFIVVPLISSGTFGFPTREAAKCHIQSFIIFAQRMKQHATLKTMKLALFLENELTYALEEFLDLQHAFPSSIFYGLPSEQGNTLGKSYCVSCKKIRNETDFKVSSMCCGKICDVCAYQYQLTTCFNCLRTIEFNYNGEIYCHTCEQIKPEGLCHCRLICAECFTQNSEKYRGICVCGYRLN